MKNRIQIITTKCDRCGKTLATTNRSVLGLDGQKKKWGNICSDCVSESERNEILQEQGQAIVSKNSPKI